MFDKKKVVQVLLLLVICCIPIIIISGCGADSCVRCTACGDDDTRFIVYASGTDARGIEYLSCVGPAGILGCGIDSKFWPTECVSIKIVDSDSKTTSGCVTFYNEAGCIAKTGVKSNGSYTTKSSCLGIDCGGSTYVETVANTTQATEVTTSCLGCALDDKKTVTPQNINNSVPRSFPNGCWAND